MSKERSRRNLKEALNLSKKMANIIRTDEDKISDEDRKWIVQATYDNFEHHINKGFLEYRKSVTESGDFALTDWSGQGSILRDIMGREYIDMLGGYGLYSYGIRHPKIVEAAKAQLDRSPQYSQEMLDPLRAQLGQIISKITPGDIQCGFFANSGTEAVDGAMKLAKLHTGKSGFISTLGAFHGKSLAALSLLGKSVFREPVLPLYQNVRHVEYGSASAIEDALKAAQTVGDGIAAVIVEPVQGEAGAIAPPDDYWPKLRAICDKYGVLLIADEVQTGFGRTGEIFGVDNWNVTPDIMCFGKALGGGVVAMSGFFSTAKIWECMEPNPFIHTTTTGGNPLACSAAIAAIEVMLEEDTPKQAKEKGNYIIDKVNSLQKKYPNILVGIQGKGLLLGLIFPDDEIGYKISSGLFARNVLVAGTLNNARVIRIEPALNIPYKLIDEMLEKLEDTIASIAKGA